MKTKLLLFLLLVFIFFSNPSNSFAHSGGGMVGNFFVKFSEEPVALIAGEKSKITISVFDKSGNPKTNLKGTLIVKELKVNQFVGVDAEQEYEEIFQEERTTDADGEVTLDYVFPKDSYYEVEFAWGHTHETESSANVYHPISLKQPKDSEGAIEDIYKFMAIGAIGVAVGAFATFILLTSTLRPKKA